MNNKEGKFGLGVFTCIFNKDFSKILLLKRNAAKRAKHGSDWGNIGGKMELGEKIIDACIREIKEEIGVVFNPEKLTLVEIRERPLSDAHHAVNFAHVALLDEGEEITLNDESDEHRWFDINNLPEKMIDSVEDILGMAEKAKKILGD